MPLQITEVGPDALTRYASVPMTTEVTSILLVEPLDDGLGGLSLREAPVERPYTKDYDDDGGPLSWPLRFDVSRWGFFLAEEPRRGLVGAAAVAWNTDGVNMLEGRADLGVLWDLRVRPEARRSGVGRALMGRAVPWLRERGCRRLKIETQNVNPRACRFYQALGCDLGAIHRFAYHDPGVASEVMLLWYLDL